MGEVSCWLFAPPQPPVALVPGEAVVLGRSPRCRLTIASPQASRRHASIGWEGAVVVLRDLGSTNGTFVNGERIDGERVLTPGDRIEVGDTVVTFCRVQDARADAEEPSEAMTVLVEHARAPAAPEVLRGDLREIPVFAVLQMLEMGAKSGALAVDGEIGACRVWLDAGRVIHAETDKASGFEAAVAVAQVQEGRFSFEPGAVPERPSLAAGVTEIILEASRQMDEAGA